MPRARAEAELEHGLLGELSDDTVYLRRLHRGVGQCPERADEGDRLCIVALELEGLGRVVDSDDRHVVVRVGQRP